MRFGSNLTAPKGSIPIKGWKTLDWSILYAERYHTVNCAYTHTCTPLCGYRLSIGPPEGFSSWWLSDQLCWFSGSVVRMSVFSWRTFPDLCLIYAWHWPLCGWNVCYGSTNQANSAFHLSGVRKWVVIHVINVLGLRGWRPLNGKSELRMAVWLQGQSTCTGLCLRPTGCTPALSVTQQRRCSCSCRLWRHISVMLCLYPTAANNDGLSGHVCRTDIEAAKRNRLEDVREHHRRFLHVVVFGRRRKMFRFDCLN